MRTTISKVTITYDGKVSMCCYDWGSSHSVGYVDELAIKTGSNDLKKFLIKQKMGLRIRTYEFRKIEILINLNK